MKRDPRTRSYSRSAVPFPGCHSVVPDQRPTSAAIGASASRFEVACRVADRNAGAECSNVSLERYRLVCVASTACGRPRRHRRVPGDLRITSCAIRVCTVDRMRRSSLPILALLGVILIAGMVSFTRLETTPPHVSGDEAHFAVHAHALAVTGRDDNGTALPLFFHLADPVRPERRTEAWWQPMLFYAMAAALRVAPLSAMTIRMVVAVVALVNIVLITLSRDGGSAAPGTVCWRRLLGAHTGACHARTAGH